MLKTISWNQFLTFWAIALTGYYAAILLLYYRRELVALLSRKVLPASAEERNSVPGAGTSNPLMGSMQPENAAEAFNAPRGAVASVPAEGLSLLEAEQLIISAPQASSSSDALLVGTVADLLEEIKMLALVIAEGNSTKEEFLSLFEALFARYPQLVDTRYPAAISLLVQGTCQGNLSFELTLAELNGLWPHE